LHGNIAAMLQENTQWRTFQDLGNLAAKLAILQ